MSSNTDKLIKQGITYSDKIFEVIKERVLQDLKNSKDLQDFLERTKDFTVSNPLTSTGYDTVMINIVGMAVNQNEYLRGKQRELVRTAIQEATSQLIVNVGEDLKQKVRETVKTGFDEGWSNQKIAQQLTKDINTINRTRARTIARTETSRASTVADYITHNERGAIGFTVSCRPDCCPLCASDYAGMSESEYTDFQENNTSGKLIGGEHVFSMSDTDMLPPRHPNCYDSETMVFTDNGWKYFKELHETDKILSLNPQTNETEFLKPLKLISHPNDDGFMYHIHNKWFDICVTPDHDCFVYENDNPTFVKTSGLNNNHSFVKNVINGNINLLNYSYCIVDEIKYDGMVYCVELPKYHTLWVMRNGKTSWNGNCRCTANYVYDETMTDNIRSQIELR